MKITNPRRDFVVFIQGERNREKERDQGRFCKTNKQLYGLPRTDYLQTTYRILKGIKLYSLSVFDSDKPYPYHREHKTAHHGAPIGFWNIPNSHFDKLIFNPFN